MSQDLILTLLIAAVVFMVLSRTVSFADSLMPMDPASIPSITTEGRARLPESRRHAPRE